MLVSFRMSRYIVREGYAKLSVHFSQMVHINVQAVAVNYELFIDGAASWEPPVYWYTGMSRYPREGYAKLSVHFSQIVHINQGCY
jgi:hypothetical protein